ncbi:MULTISPECIES: hypothetical protein [unclassified Clostridium]|uniref:hypothetical protein n=1 Tax=unclassified Clostridium TaxID=2614128 RepID=UPI000298192C|nr:MULTISPECIES: hypothetical protein [unclassified Clostridium]EKQ56261.1 MAG: hypothetical protein A370_02017 [Clostridium sp. Maddingley MBC34-26]
MKYRILDTNGDYSFGKGQQNLTYGTFAVKQAIQTKLGLLKGEWWENKELGLPLFQSILGQIGVKDNISIVDTLIKKQIIGTIDVTGIESFSSIYDSANRSYLFTCKVNTKYGNITVEESL